MIRARFFMPVLALFLSCANAPEEETQTVLRYQPFPDPNVYVCRQIDQVVVDGNLTEWSQIEWTDLFVDIEGDRKPAPQYRTRAKIAWDDSCLYIAAEMEEPHVWATITERDAVIFYDNDFEVFIDPDGDTHHYYELEVNALTTAWDLLLTMPYRDFGYAIDSWDIAGLKVGVSVDGTLNDPSDTDKGWTVEIAIPFKVLEECNSQGGMPAHGDYWRINFSRVEWKTEVVDNRYVKQIDPATGKVYPENNWVWSPQYHVNMHMPEFWGFLVFSDSSISNIENWKIPEDEVIKWHLRNVYYLQRQFMEQNQRYANSIYELGWTRMDLNLPSPDYLKTFDGYQAVLKGEKNSWLINDKGKIVKLPLQED